jgi:5-amino-6-(5-phosphoribosylamino)uracil reductase
VTVNYNLLIPRQAVVDVDALLAEWDPHAGVDDARPRVSVNFAVTADGSAALADGKSGGIGDQGDLAVFRGLRDRVDAVLAGTQTIAAEGYRRLVRDDARRAERVGRGLVADPLAATISRSGVLPLGAPMLSDLGQRTVAFVPLGFGEHEAANGHSDQAAATESQPSDPADASAYGEDAAQAADDPSSVVAGGVERVELNPVTPEAALAHLAGMGVRSVLCEGGPRLVSALAGADLVDDVFLTIAPKLAGGGPGMTSGAPLNTPTTLQLTHVAEREGSLFLRWSRPA